MIDHIQSVLTDVINPVDQAKMSMESIRTEYPFESHYIDIGGYNYHYVDEGEGTPILMVHGNPTWSFFYRRLIKAYSKQYRVIAPDHMGCGLSEKPQHYDYHLENHIDNLETLILRLNLRRITLIVHDWGGAIGLGCAIRHQHRFARIIIMNSTAFTVPKFPWYIHFLRTPVIGDFFVRNLNLFATGLAATTPQYTLPPMVAQGLSMPYNSYENRIALHKFILDTPISPADFSYEILLQIEYGLWMFKDRPIAIIWGMQDPYYPPEMYLTRWRKIYPQAKFLEIDYAGYYLLEDAPVTVARFIRNFIQDTSLFDEE